MFLPTDEIAERRYDLNQKDAFYDHEHFNDERFHQTHAEVTQKNGLKAEIRENIERVKESVRKWKMILKNWAEQIANECPFQAPLPCQPNSIQNFINPIRFTDPSQRS
jgi:hypothetical protein